MAPGDIFGVIPIWIGVYALAIIAFTLSGLAVYRRVISLVMLGKPVNRSDQPMRRFTGMAAIVFGQRKVLQRFSLKDKAGLGHFLIFWGFISFALSYVIFIFADSAWRPFSQTILTEAGVKVYTVYLDIAAVVVLACLIWGVLRRWVAQPHRLTFDLTRSRDAIIIVALISSLMLLTLLTEAFFIAAGGTGPEASVPVGGAIGRWFASLGLGADAANLLQGITWWLHLGVILGFGVYIPFSKHMHMIASPPNAFFRNLNPRGTLSPIPNLETAETFGAGKIQDFTWKELLDGYACAVCGRCTDSCPANISGKVLSPMHIVELMKDHLIKAGPSLRAARQSDGDGTGNGHTPSTEETQLIGGVIPEQAIWDCVTCGACMQECPVACEHIDSIVDMRRFLVMEKSAMPETAMQTLRSLEQRGHPWRGTQATRTDWMKGLDVKTVAEDPNIEVLLWVGCTPALDERAQAIPRALASLLKVAGVKFAVLGNEEMCTGDPARRLGNEYLFQILAQQNIETFKRYDVKKILTMCPHCFNTIKNEYPQLGGKYEVMHYSQFVGQLVKEGRIKPVKAINTIITYHDPCYLGRHNGVYDPQREIASAIPGLTLVEMERNRSRSFCCGAGGGHAWVEEAGGQRVNHMRTDQFLQTGADTVAVSCPFCLQMFTEGISAKAPEGKKQAKDLLELLAESVENPQGE